MSEGYDLCPGGYVYGGTCLVHVWVCFVLSPMGFHSRTVWENTLAELVVGA